MKQFNYQRVESAIGYQFNNKKLLEQAFTRSSFANENGCESNEVLEFIGDKVLDLAVIRILLEKFTKTNSKNEYFITTKSEGELTKIKSELVNTASLAASFECLFLEDFIRYGKSDLGNNTKRMLSIEEDTLEAIIGAIAVDSHWDMKILIDRVKAFLNINNYFKHPQVDTNYVGDLQEWLDLIGYGNPIYRFDRVNKNGSLLWRATLSIKEINQKTIGYGDKQKEAKREAARQMLDVVKLIAKKIAEQKASNKDVLADINYLVQMGEIEKPLYKFDEMYDKDGNPYWKCSTTIQELGYVYYGYGNSKKEAQRNSLEEALKDIE